LGINVVATGSFQFTVPNVVSRPDYYVRFQNAGGDFGSSELFCIKPSAGSVCDRSEFLISPVSDRADGWVSLLESLNIVMFK